MANRNIPANQPAVSSELGTMVVPPLAFKLPVSTMVALGQILDQVSTPVWLKGADRRYHYVNAACARLHGLSPSQMLGRTDDDLHGQEAAMASLLLDQEALRQPGTRVTTETVQWGAAAAPVSLQVIRQAIVDGAGRVPNALACRAEPVADMGPGPSHGAQPGAGAGAVGASHLRATLGC